MDNKVEGKEVFDAVLDEMEQIEKHMSTEELEAELIKEQSQPKDPVEAAAMGFNLYSFKFKQGVDQLSARGAKRLLKALVDGKLSGKKYNLNQFEATMLEVGTFCMECRFIMELDTYNNARAVLEKAADPNQELSQEEIDMLQAMENNKEETNG